MGSRYYSAITLWMLQVGLYRHKIDGRCYVAFYDVLEAMVKRSMYRPQTLDKIYNNLSKEILIKGLQELWDQRTQLSMDSDNYVKHIEDLRYYYNSKTKRGENPEYELIKVRLSSLVWTILTICKSLRHQIKKRKFGTREESKTGSKPFDASIVTLLLRSITREADGLTVANFGGQTMQHNQPRVESRPTHKSKFKHNEPKHHVPMESRPTKTKVQLQLQRPGHSPMGSSGDTTPRETFGPVPAK